MAHGFAPSRHRRTALGRPIPGSWISLIIQLAAHSFNGERVNRGKPGYAPPTDSSTFAGIFGMMLSMGPNPSTSPRVLFMAPIPLMVIAPLEDEIRHLRLRLQNQSRLDLGG